MGYGVINPFRSTGPGWVLTIFLIIASCITNNGAKAVELDVSTRAKGGHVVPGEIIIEVKRGIIDMGSEKGIAPEEKVSIKSESIDALNRKYNLVSVERLFSGTRKDEPSDIYVFRFSKDVNIDKLVSAYEKDSSVLYAEPNYTVHVE